MPTQPMTFDDPARTALLIARCNNAHHFEGVAAALSGLGWSTRCETLQHCSPIWVSPTMTEPASAVLHVESLAGNAGPIVESCKRSATPAILMMDGVLEYANTFLNPNTGDRFLRPAPADVVLASGSHDQAILNAMGNISIPTGLPRLSQFAQRVRAVQADINPSGLLVASANQPAFTNGGRARLLKALSEIRSVADKRNLAIRWRVGSEIADELGVENDRCELFESLARVEMVMTSASTLAIESMIASKPTAIVHPHPWALWIPCAWCYRGASNEGWDEDLDAIQAVGGLDERANTAAADSIAQIAGSTQRFETDSFVELFNALHAPTGELMAMQDRIVEHAHRPDAPVRVARAIVDASRPKAIGLSIDIDSQRPRDDEIIKRFEALLAQGCSQIAIAMNNEPTEAMVWIVEHHNEQLAGFVVLDQDDLGSAPLQFLGVRACGHRRVNELLTPDGLVVMVPQGDYSLAAAMHRYWGARWAARWGAGLAMESNLEPKSIEQIESVMGDGLEAMTLGSLRTTLAPGILDGARSCSIEIILDGQAPTMLVLKGDEIDFKIYQRSKAWRDAGMRVRSLRWSDDELGSPERFGDFVDELGDQPYAIFGSGEHTRRLLTYSDQKSQPRFILDDRAGQNGVPTELLGVPIVHPTYRGLDKLAAIVLSSLRHESTMWERTASLRDQGVRVIPLYCTVDELEDELETKTRSINGLG